MSQRRKLRDNERYPHYETRNRRFGVRIADGHFRDMSNASRNFYARHTDVLHCSHCDVLSSSGSFGIFGHLAAHILNSSGSKTATDASATAAILTRSPVAHIHHDGMSTKLDRNRRRAR